MHLSNQDEDSEDEPKLKYERLANGVTEILHKDAASCMTVHDKVEVISLRSTHQQHIPHCLWILWRNLLFPCAQPQCPQSILFSPFAVFSLREAHQRSFCLFLVYSFSYTFFLLHFSVKGWLFWERGTLILMFNRGGTSGTNARLSRAEVTSGHVFYLIVFF